MITSVLWIAYVATLVIATQTPGAPVTVPNDLVITLRRTACFGTCPDYTVSINAKGHVTYDGRQYVRIKEHRTDTIPRSSVEALVETIERIGFFELKAVYTKEVTDQPTTFVTVTRNGQTKQVEDYLGAPDALIAFEKQIDDAVRIKRWVWYDERSFQERLDKGWKPTAAELAKVLEEAVRRDDASVAQSAIARGANLALAFGERSPLMMVRSGAVARVLLEAGAQPSFTGPNGGTPLGESVQDPPEIAEALIKAGARVDQPCDDKGGTPLWYAARAGNVDVVKLLLDAGADPTVAPGGVSAVAATREALQEKAQETDPLENYLGKLAFRRDFDAVIALLEQAQAARRARH